MIAALAALLKLFGLFAEWAQRRGLTSAGEALLVTDIISISLNRIASVQAARASVTARIRSERGGLRQRDGDSID